MRILGNILIALAGLLYLVPLQLMLSDAGRRRGDGGAVWGSIFVLTPLWLLLTAALLVAAGRGGFDWLPVKRGSQYALVLVSGIALLVVTFFSFMSKAEHISQLPWVVRLFTSWAVVLFPLVTMAFLAFALNPSLGPGLKPPTLGLPFVAVAGFSLLACGGMLIEAMIHAQQQQQARVEEAVEADNQRDRDIMARVQSLQAANDLPELLGFTNRFEKPEIRQAAIAKVEADPQLIARLAETLQSGWAEKGLVYLDACEVSAEDRKILAAPVRTAIETLTAEAKDSVERTHTFYAEQFDWNTRIILSVADKFEGEGLDYGPAIREFRRALDSERTRDVRLNARQTLDRWLAKHPQ
ncbi:MAG: hypothetical protein GC160_08510 [Acidobacteria bacterium]|nr:hypothetical protein [Acidobacteriota bacterium]